MLLITINNRIQCVAWAGNNNYALLGINQWVIIFMIISTLNTDMKAATQPEQDRNIRTSDFDRSFECIQPQTHYTNYTDMQQNRSPSPLLPLPLLPLLLQRSLTIPLTAHTH